MSAGGVTGSVGVVSVGVVGVVTGIVSVGGTTADGVVVVVGVVVGVVGVVVVGVVGVVSVGRVVGSDPSLGLRMTLSDGVTEEGATGLVETFGLVTFTNHQSNGTSDAAA